MSIINFDSVSFSYDKKEDAVKNLSFSVEKGEYLAIVGHNGSGKSTIAKLLNAICLPDSGTVKVDGMFSSDKKSLFDIRKKVGVVFQNPDNQLIASIVVDDVAFGPENLGLDRNEIGKRIDYALKAVNMEKYKNSSPTRLSGGQKQRIAIAGVLALMPDVLVLDESTAMLDPAGRKEVLDVIKRLNDNGTTIITITHYMEEVVDADRVLVLKEGEKIFEGTPSEVFSNLEILEQAGLELPLATYISKELVNNGVVLPEGILTKEKLLEELCKL